MPKLTRGAMNDAYTEVLERIVSLQLAPASRIDDIALASDLGVSRTPVREALFQLASEGFVTSSRGGFHVRDLDLLDVRNLFDAHAIAAQGVALLLAQRATPDDLKQLTAATIDIDRACEAEDPKRITEANAVLHILEAQLTGNEYLFDLMSRIIKLEQRLAYVSFGGVHSPRYDDSLRTHYASACSDHHSHLDALTAGDGSRAAAVAVEHVQLFQGRILRILNEGTDRLRSTPIAVL